MISYTFLVRAVLVAFVLAGEWLGWWYGNHGSRCSFIAIALACTFGCSAPTMAQTITDGDTIKQGGVTYRLWGIDAPETKQDCPDGWPAGRVATTKLQALVTGRQIVCERKDADRYGRAVAICRAGGEDLGSLMVRSGMAWAFIRYSSDYVDQEVRAKAAGLGVHGHDCAPAWEWRAQQRGSK